MRCASYSSLVQEALRSGRALLFFSCHCCLYWHSTGLLIKYSIMSAIAKRQFARTLNGDWHPTTVMIFCQFYVHEQASWLVAEGLKCVISQLLNLASTAAYPYIFSRVLLVGGKSHRTTWEAT